MRIFDANPQELAQSLVAARQRTLGLVRAWAQALPDLRVPFQDNLNLPLWEWGHVAWFQGWWIGRNRQRHQGVNADPDHPRAPSPLAQADEWYDSSRVAHETRWQLTLPQKDRVLSELERTLDETLNLLWRDGPAGEDLYFYHLVLRHEDMHNEAAVYMAQTLGLPIPDDLVRGRPLEDVHHARGEPIRPSAVHGLPSGKAQIAAQVQVPEQLLMRGHQGPGFCFDNELHAHPVQIPAFRIDAEPVPWSAYLPFLCETAHPWPAHIHWTDEAVDPGRSVRPAPATGPKKPQEGCWWRRRFDRWEPLPLQAPADFLSALDAQAWCRWAGRALPTETQWECAARSAEPSPFFRWGEVWEWTSSDFLPYPGFRPHPYRDYSKPWFGTHRVLRGASAFTSRHIASPTYRNFFLPNRSDIPAGFRTVEPGPR